MARKRRGNPTTSEEPVATTHPMENRAQQIDVTQQGLELPPPEDLLAGPVYETYDPLTGEITGGDARISPDGAEDAEVVSEEGATEDQEQEQPQGFETDPRFGGDPNKVYQSYTSLESKLGEQGEELKRYRQLFDQHLQNQAQQKPQQPVQQPDKDGINEKTIETLNQFLTDPDGYMAQREQQWMQNLQARAMQNEVVRLKSEHAQTLQDPAFFKRMQEANVPHYVVEAADRDPQALDWLLRTYGNAPSAPNPTAVKQQGAEEASTKIRTARAASSPPPTRKTEDLPVFTYAQLRDMQLYEPEKYEALQPQIMSAIRQGRVK